MQRAIRRTIPPQRRRTQHSDMLGWVYGRVGISSGVVSVGNTYLALSEWQVCAFCATGQSVPERDRTRQSYMPGCRYGRVLVSLGNRPICLINRCPVFCCRRQHTCASNRARYCRNAELSEFVLESPTQFYLQMIPCFLLSRKIHCVTFIISVGHKKVKIFLA